MEKMTRTKAVLAFLNQNTGKPVTNAEFLAFWKDCSETDRRSYGESAARSLGVELAD